MRSAPDYIQFYPTLRCNQACDFCFNRSLPPMADMTQEAFRAMLDKLHALPVRTLDIIGGEPTLHPDIASFISEANNMGLHVNLSSNGTNTKLLEEIMKTGERTTVGVSINDHESLARLSSFIREHRPVVKTVFSRSGDAALIAEVLLLDPDKFYLIYRDALSSPELDETVPFPLYRDVVAGLSSFREIGMVYCSGFIPDRSYPELSNVRCPAGTTKLGVMPDGSVYPCNLFFGNARFLLGNILMDPFESIWNHRALAFFRAGKKNVCPQSSCALFASCRGGCPAEALLLSGDLAAPDPRCIRKTGPGGNLV